MFFIHPTTYTRHISSSNAAIDDDYLAAKSDFPAFSTRPACSTSGRGFSPPLPAVIHQGFLQRTRLWQASFDTAYSDVAAAFQYYLLHWNQGRPFIIAGHSQGSLIAERLLKEFVEISPATATGGSLCSGWPVPKNYFRSLKMCADSTETGCICSWRTLRRNYLPDYLKNETAILLPPIHSPGQPMAVTRPEAKTWAAYCLNSTVFSNQPRMPGSKMVCSLFTSPGFPGAFCSGARNYHVGDINLYYMNLRHNAGQRIAAFLR